MVCIYISAVLPVFIGLLCPTDALRIRSTLWNYDVVRNTVEIIIYARKDHEEWLEKLSPGKIIQYLDPEEIIIQGLNAETYYLIGNTDAQAFFYQLNRSLPFTSTVNSFIYSKNTGEFFPDIDDKYPYFFTRLIDWVWCYFPK